jgi:hypothetical protein
MNGNANRGELEKSAESRHSRATDRRCCSGGRRGQLSRSGAKRFKLSQLVAGGRYELYSNYALQIQAVAASVTATP